MAAPYDIAKPLPDFIQGRKIGEIIRLRVCAMWLDAYSQGLVSDRVIEMAYKAEAFDLIARNTGNAAEVALAMRAIEFEFHGFG